MKILKAALIIAIILAGLNYISETSNTQGEAVLKKKTGTSSTNFAKYEQPDRKLAHACEKISPINTAQRPKLDIDFDNATTSRKNIDEILIEFKTGSALSAIALFLSARNCSEYGRLLDPYKFSFNLLSKNECKKIDPNLLNNPLLILEPAAEAGVADAQLLYMKNAPIMAEIFRDNNLKSEIVSKILGNAERYGREAAEAGSSDAYALMAYSFYSGAFGYIDLPRSYAYTLASVQKGDNEIENRLQFLYSNLTGDQLRKAKSLVGNCEPLDVGQDVLINPFR